MRSAILALAALTLSSGVSAAVVDPAVGQAVGQTGIKGAQTGVKGAKPGVSVAKPDLNVTIPDVNVAKPDVNVAKPGVNVTKPDVNVAKPDVNVTKPDDQTGDKDKVNDTGVKGPASKACKSKSAKKGKGADTRAGSVEKDAGGEDQTTGTKDTEEDNGLKDPYPNVPMVKDKNIQSIVQTKINSTKQTEQKSIKADACHAEKPDANGLFLSCSATINIKTKCNSITGTSKATWNPQEHDEDARERRRILIAEQKKCFYGPESTFEHDNLNGCLCCKDEAGLAYNKHEAYFAEIYNKTRDIFVPETNEYMSFEAAYDKILLDLKKPEETTKNAPKSIDAKWYCEKRGIPQPQKQSHGIFNETLVEQLKKKEKEEAKGTDKENKDNEVAKDTPTRFTHPCDTVDLPIVCAVDSKKVVDKPEQMKYRLNVNNGTQNEVQKADKNDAGDFVFMMSAKMKVGVKMTFEFQALQDVEQFGSQGQLDSTAENLIDCKHYKEVAEKFAEAVTGKGEDVVKEIDGANKIDQRDIITTAPDIPVLADKKQLIGGKVKEDPTQEVKDLISQGERPGKGGKPSVGTTSPSKIGGPTKDQKGGPQRNQVPSSPIQKGNTRTGQPSGKSGDSTIKSPSGTNDRVNGPPDSPLGSGDVRDGSNPQTSRPGGPTPQTSRPGRTTPQTLVPDANGCKAGASQCAVQAKEIIATIESQLAKLKSACP